MVGISKQIHVVSGIQATAGSNRLLRHWHETCGTATSYLARNMGELHTDLDTKVAGMASIKVKVSKPSCKPSVVIFHCGNKVTH